MTDGGRSRRPRDVARALGLGALVFVGVAVLGQLIAIALFVARGADGSIAEHAGIGWLYFAAFHGIPVDVTATESGGVDATRVTVALLLPTFAAVWLSFVAGRAAARDAVGHAAWRVLVASVVAVPYATASFLLSLVVTVHLDLTVTDNLAGAPVDVSADPIAALARPFAVALVPAIAGALAAARRPDLLAVRGAFAAVAGGTRAFVLALLLAFVGLLVNAGADPAATRSYFAVVSEPSAVWTATIIGHHVLVLPNQSVWVLVPAMGGADELRIGDTEQTLVSYGAAVTEIGVAVPSGAGAAPTVSSQPLPRAYLLFLLVPAVATFLGGARAAHVARSLSRALALGAGAGVVYAALVVVASAASALAWETTSVSTDGLAIEAGPDVARAAVLALAWGVAGGAVGAWWRSAISAR